MREIAYQTLNAIEFLHSLKLTHTDLKPENILLVSDEKETITDESLFPIVSLIFHFMLCIVTHFLFCFRISKYKTSAASMELRGAVKLSSLAIFRVRVPRQVDGLAKSGPDPPPVRSS